MKKKKISAMLSLSLIALTSSCANNSSSSSVQASSNSPSSLTPTSEPISSTTPISTPSTPNSTLSTSVHSSTPSTPVSTTSSTSKPASTPVSTSTAPKVEYQKVPYQNPIPILKDDGTKYFVTTADPTILKADDGYYYMYITNANCIMGNYGQGFDRGPIFRSRDLTSWKWCGSVFKDYPDKGNWGTNGAGVWAPSVIKVNDHQYNYYYSLSSWGDPNPGIGVAISPTPYGPWIHYEKLLDQNITGVKNGIDPFVTFDEEGNLWIFWGSFFGIAGAMLTDDGTELFYGQEHAKEHLVWLVENNNGDSMDIDTNYEGSFIIKHNGKYILMGSQGTCLAGDNSTYRVKAGISDSLFGPYVAKNGATMDKAPYGELVVEPSDEVAGTGHHCVIVDEAGAYYMIYHGFDKYGENSQERSLFMDRLYFDEDGYPYIEDYHASIRKTKLGPTVLKVQE